MTTREPRDEAIDDARHRDRATDRDERLAALVGHLADELRAGRSAELDALCCEHADLADELRPLWAAMLVVDCVAAQADHVSAELRNGEIAPPCGDRTLPHTPAGTAGGPIDRGAAQSETWDEGVAAGLPRQFGDYELVAELGRGGMGVVYKARQLSLGRTVAVKMILRGQLASPAELARFRGEAESVARLDHPHIVPVYEVGECDGQPFFTMKWVGGTTLARRLADGPMPAREAATLLAPICRAIHFAHQHGILHRDLKPSNILIDREGRAHVTDFGLAKRIEGDQQLTLSGAILGTPCYMAPEQAAGTRGHIGPASDVYSLGTILYQMLTGHPPFQAASPVDTVLMVLEQEPLPPRLVNASADRELEMIALKCLQKPADLRYATANALADDLEAYLADEPIAARSGLFSQVVDRWFRETHHATVLENWGLLWMWHSLALLIICVLTNWLQWRDVKSPLPYLGLWTAGMGAWAAVFWGLRRRAGPVTFVERQIAHIWAGSMASIVLLYIVEILLGMPVLTLSPILGITSGMAFLIKAGILTGRFYVQAAALFATAAAMAVLEHLQLRFPIDITLFGVVSAACFFFPGLKYYRQRSRGLRK